MEQREYNTFAFFRRYFGLPRRSALEWCVVKESTREGWGISKPKSYVPDIYYNSVFSKELLKTRLM